MHHLVKIAVIFALLSGAAQAKETGRIFVSNEKSNDVYVFDKDFNLIKSIDTSQRPRDMKLNADRHFFSWHVVMMT